MITWQTRIQALLDIGSTLKGLADELGAPISTLNDLHKGRSVAPRGELALRIDALYRARCLSARRIKTASPDAA